MHTGIPGKYVSGADGCPARGKGKIDLPCSIKGKGLAGRRV